MIRTRFFSKHCSFLHRLVATTLPLFALLCAQNNVLALADDARQQIVVEANSSEFFPDQGLFIHHGSDVKPARITQGSLQISGAEIRIERNADGTLKMITTSGSPARFQQQPAIDEAIIHASGKTLVFDNNTQLLTIETEAEFIQQGYTIRGHRIDYDLVKRSASATSLSPEDQLIMTIPPTEN